MRRHDRSEFSDSIIDLGPAIALLYDVLMWSWDETSGAELPRGEDVKGTLTSGNIESLSDFDVIYKRIKAHVQQIKTVAVPKGSKRHYLLSQFVLCGKCGAIMQINKTERETDGETYVHTAYKCPSREQSDENGQRKCDCPSIRRKYLERWVMDEVFIKVFAKASLGNVTDRLNAYIASRAQKSEIELAEVSKLLQNKLETIKRSEAQGSDGQDGRNCESENGKALVKIKALQDKKARLERRRDGMVLTPNDVIHLIALIRNPKFRNLQIPVIRRFLAAYLIKITVDDEEICVYFNIPEDARVPQCPNSEE